MIPIEGVAIYKLHTALFFVSCNDGLGTTCTYAISIIKIFIFCLKKTKKKTNWSIHVSSLGQWRFEGTMVSSGSLTQANP